jgi:hypothetical protein
MTYIITRVIKKIKLELVILMLNIKWLFICSKVNGLSSLEIWRYFWSEKTFEFFLKSMKVLLKGGYL